uniref:Uncharacterized protein n=1 Tax=Amphimedon queenslandica TaxID=400682 RepID=A0A1X7TWL9_AMPQE
GGFVAASFDVASVSDVIDSFLTYFNILIRYPGGNLKCFLMLINVVFNLTNRFIINFRNNINCIVTSFHEAIDYVL